MTFFRIYFVRHGITEANQLRIIQGHQDIELNELGFKQAALVAERLQHVPFDIAFSSDLSRSMKTAEAILSFHPGVIAEPHKDLRGQFMGNLEGQEYTPGVALPVDETVETPDAFTERVTRWWNEYLLRFVVSLPRKSDQSPYEILVASHEAVIEIIMQSLRKQDKACGQGIPGVSSSPNTSVSVVELDRDGKGVVVEYGDASHLEELSEMNKTQVDAVVNGGMRN